LFFLVWYHSLLLALGKVCDGTCPSPPFQFLSETGRGEAPHFFSYSCVFVQQSFFPNHLVVDFLPLYVLSKTPTCPGSGKAVLCGPFPSGHVKRPGYFDFFSLPWPYALASKEVMVCSPFSLSVPCRSSFCAVRVTAPHSFPFGLKGPRAARAPLWKGRILYSPLPLFFFNFHAGVPFSLHCVSPASRPPTFCRDPCCPWETPIPSPSFSLKIGFGNRFQAYLPPTIQVFCLRASPDCSSQCEAGALPRSFPVAAFSSTPLRFFTLRRRPPSVQAR